MYKKANLAKGTLSAQLLVAGTSLVLQTDEGLKFPNTGSGNLFVGVIWGAAYSSPEADATHEFVEAYRSSGDTFTIVRAKESTSAKQWEIGDNFMLTASAAVFDEYEAALTGKAPALGADDNYVTADEKVKLANLSGINSGDQRLSDGFLVNQIFN